MKNDQKVYTSSATSFLRKGWQKNGLVSFLLGFCIVFLLVLLLKEATGNREEQSTARILEEKGASLIRSFEAGARATLRQNDAGIRLQVLLEEMADQSDILFIAVVDEQGKILAHSDQEQQGQAFFSDKTTAVTGTLELQHSIMTFDNHSTFLVYRKFMPVDMNGAPFMHNWSLFFEQRMQQNPRLGLTPNAVPFTPRPSIDSLPESSSSLPSQESHNANSRSHMEDMRSDNSNVNAGISSNLLGGAIWRGIAQNGRMNGGMTRGSGNSMTRGSGNGMTRGNDMMRGSIVIDGNTVTGNIVMGGRGHGHNNGVNGMMGRRDQRHQELWATASEPVELEKIPSIFVGLDATPWMLSKKADGQHLLLIASLVIACGIIVGLLSYFSRHARMAVKRLRDAESFALEIVDSLPDGLLFVDDSGTYATYNQATERLLQLNPRHDRHASHGITDIQVMPVAGTDSNISNLHKGEPAEQLESAKITAPRKHLGKSMLVQNLPTPLPQIIQDKIARLTNMQTPVILEVDSICTLADGSVVPLALHVTKLRTPDILSNSNEQQEIEDSGCLFVLHDQREIKSLQEEIRRKEKLAATGSLAAGVAHELRNPLSSIKGYATYFSTRFPPDSDERNAAEIMIKETERLNRTITDLITFARPLDVAPNLQDAGALVGYVLKLVAQDAKVKNITVEYAPDADVPFAMVDEDRFSQALLNVIINGFDAMPEGGLLRVIVRKHPKDIHMIQVVVEDSGVGMSAETAKQSFDPYFTTKSQGTGLGLVITHKIMEAHNGSIYLEPRSEGGTRVVFTLPVQ